MRVVSNATPIISLASIGYLSLLPDLFKKIYIPQAVYNEIKYKKSYGYQEIDNPYFEVVTIQGNDYLGFLLNDLDKGEAEAIFLTKELKATRLPTTQSKLA
jgi:predicted nucleic acid-binding protein